MPYIARSYSEFQMIGYEVYTGTTVAGEEEDLNLDFGVDNDKTGTPYLPLPDAEEVKDKDARIRLKRLAGVIDFARNSIWDPAVPPGVLKIFMAPEFYFRPETAVEIKGKKSIKHIGSGEREILESTASVRCYSSETKNEMVSALKTIFAHELFTDWLIVAGSIVWEDKHRQPWMGEEGLVSFVRNSAIVVKGGREGGIHLRLIDKLNVSNADEYDDKAISRPKIWLSELIGSIYRRQHAVFGIDNVQFGIEICLDHGQDKHVLKSTFNELDREERRYTGTGIPPIQIHLLPACSMGLSPTSVAARQDGYILREDGVRRRKSKLGGGTCPFTQIEKVTRQTYDDIDRMEIYRQSPLPQGLSAESTLAAVPDRTTISPVEVDGWPKEQTILPALQVRAANNPDRVDTEHPQRIVWSSVLEIPG